MCIDLGRRTFQRDTKYRKWQIHHKLCRVKCKERIERR